MQGWPKALLWIGSLAAANCVVLTAWALDGPYDLPAATAIVEARSLCGIPFVVAEKRAEEFGSFELEGSCGLEVVVEPEGETRISVATEGGSDSQFCARTLSAITIKAADSDLASVYCVDGETSLTLPVAAAGFEYVDLVAAGLCPVSEEALRTFCDDAASAGAEVEFMLLGKIGLQNGAAACACEGKGVSAKRCGGAKDDPEPCQAVQASEVSDTVEQMLGVKTGTGSCESMCLSQFGGSKKKRNDCLDFCRGG